MPTPIPRRNRRVLVVVRFPCDGGLPQIDGGSASAIAFRGLLSVHYTFRPVCSPGRPRRPSTPKYFSGFVTSSAAPIATGRNDSCRVGFSPTENRRLCTAYVKELPGLVFRSIGRPPASCRALRGLWQRVERVCHCFAEAVPPAILEARTASAKQWHTGLPGFALSQRATSGRRRVLRASLPGGWVRLRGYLVTERPGVPRAGPRANRSNDECRQRKVRCRRLP